MLARLSLVERACLSKVSMLKLDLFYAGEKKSLYKQNRNDYNVLKYNKSNQ